MIIRRSPRARNADFTLCRLWAVPATVVLALAGCGGGGGESTTGTPHTIGGTVTGLSGSGLVLQDSGGDHPLTVSVAQSGAFTFATAVADGTPYDVTVSTQPTHPSQTCSVSHGAGTVSGSDITNVAVTCVTNSYTIGGTVTGVTGAGLVLSESAGQKVNVTGSGLYTFSASFPSGQVYSVTITTQPVNPPQTCVVSNPSGTVLGSNITNVNVECTTNTVVSNIWVPAAGMLRPRSEHAATLLHNGNVLVVGGYGIFPWPSPEVYDAVANVWSSAGSTSSGGKGPTATLLPSGTVLAAGGYECSACANGPLAATDLYDPAKNAWSAGASMSIPRGGHTATLLPNGKVLMAGGGTSPQLNYYTASAELYDPATNTWSAAASMSIARSGHTATLLTSGKVLIAGGENAQGPPATAELYDPAANVWSPAGSMSTGHWGTLSATLLPNGTVLVAGGFNTNTAPIATAELYDPVANTWSLAAPMSTPREGHTATLLQSGLVLVAGGEVDSSGSNTASTELYNPATNTWSPAASMSTPRRDNTATLLTNGVVLEAGVEGAELYYP